MNNNDCFDCKYQDIRETSHEWIECHCKFDNQWHNCWFGCDGKNKVVADEETNQ